LRAGLRFAYGVGATAEVAGQAHPAPGGRGLLVLLGGGGPARLYSLLCFTSSAASIMWELVALSSAFVLHAAIVGVWLTRGAASLSFCGSRRYTRQKLSGLEI
jgi:hypothetical protein